MLQQLRQIKSSGIEKIDFSGNFEDLDPDEAYWLEIKSDDRLPVVEFLASLKLDERVLEHIGQSEFSSRVHVISGAVVLNLPVSKTSDFLQTDYLTIFAKDNLLVTIIDEENTTIDKVEEEIRNNPFAFELNRYLVLYYMVSEVSQKDMEYACILRKRIHVLTDKMENDPEAVPLDEIINSKKEVSQLSNIVEDQYHLLSFTPRHDWTNVKETEKIISEMKYLFRGFDYLKRILERQEDKLASLHSQYQLMLQEKGNKRLNILTIVQAIFVPLTLIAGIYGMNFLKMPELQWTFGYYLILGIMGLIVLIELVWFKKKGWFD